MGLFFRLSKNLFHFIPSFSSRASSQVPLTNFGMKEYGAHNSTKRVLFLRHGQAEHNPRAEEAREKGCSHETFLSLMKEDDSFDSDLTSLGVSQGRSVKKRYEAQLRDVELVVSSPLSRALKTADLAICPNEGLSSSDGRRFHPPRICVEHFREINGYLLNAKRRDRENLIQLFHSRWDFDTCIPETDETWTDSLESQEDCGERGYQGLLWVSQRKEDNILVVCHGGILRFCMVDHPLVNVIDGRDDMGKRFGNCELREYDMVVDTSTGSNMERPVITLTEIEVD